VIDSIDAAARVAGTRLIGNFIQLLLILTCAKAENMHPLRNALLLSAETGSYNTIGRVGATAYLRLISFTIGLSLKGADLSERRIAGAPANQKVPDKHERGGNT
jgi:hypothetical protein